MPLFDLPANDTTLGEWLAGMFAGFGQSDPVLWMQTRFLEFAAAGNVEARLVGNSVTAAPRYALLRNGARTLVIIQCTENNLSALSLWNGWVSGDADTGPNVRNAHLEACATSMLEYMDANQFTQNTILIAGHSQGGAVGNALARNIFIRRASIDVKLVTFGAPKTSGAAGLAGLSGSRICRWMTPDDPVPLLPPESALASITASLGDRASARRMTYFVQPAGGRLLYADPPGIREGTIPPVAVLPSIGNFVGWLAGVESASAPHRITTYQNRLAAWNALNPRPTQQRPSGGPAQRANPATAREVTQQERIFVQNTFQAGQEQNRVILEQPKRSLFYALRQGRIWSVWLNNQQVAVGPTKKRARAIARLGNYFLTRLQRSAYVDQATLLAQVGAVIDQMADPAGGFRPPLRTELPANQP